MILEGFHFDAPKTKAFVDIINALQLRGKKVALVTADFEKEVYLSSRNVQKCNVIRANDLDTYTILNTNALVIAEDAVDKIKETFANS